MRSAMLGFRADVLPLEEAACGLAVGAGSGIQAAFGGECPAEEAGGRAEPGQGGAAGCSAKKVSRPALMKEVVKDVTGCHGYSERRA